MITYIENIKESKQMLLDLIMDFSKVAKYNIIIQKPIVFLYISNEHIKTKVKSSIHLQSLKKMKFIGLNLTMPTHDLHTKNYFKNNENRNQASK